MRLFGLLGLVLAVLVVGLLFKRQLGSAPAPAANVHEQTQQIQRQIKESLDAAVQQRKPEPDE